MLGAIAQLAPLPFSPVRTVGSLIASEVAPRIVEKLGGGPVAQTAASIGGGLIGAALRDKKAPPPVNPYTPGAMAEAQANGSLPGGKRYGRGASSLSV